MAKTYQNRRSERNLKIRKMRKLTDSPMGMWFSGKYVNGGGPMSMVEALPALLLHYSGWDGRHQKIGHRRTSWLCLPLEKMMREWEKNERVRKWGQERGEGGFCREKRRRVMENVKRWGRWREWRRKKKRLVTVGGNEKGGNTLDG